MIQNLSDLTGFWGFGVLGFGPLLCLKDIIFRLNFVLLFFFLANHAVEIASPGRERLHLGY